MSSNSSAGGFAPADRLMTAFKRNPEGLLLLAAGCALLFRTGGSPQRSHVYQSYPTAQPEQGPHIRERGSSGKDWEMPEGISRAADSATACLFA
jgi:hypothetical protein